MEVIHGDQSGECTKLEVSEETFDYILEQKRKCNDIILDINWMSCQVSNESLFIIN